jgi:glutaryl-CoA dehydrogenase (non-decarboxylating)
MRFRSISGEPLRNRRAGCPSWRVATAWAALRITLATRAERILVFAKTDPERGAQGISAFVLPRETPGVSTYARTNKMGDWAGDTGDITFDGARVPATDMLGHEGEGFKIAMSALDHGRLVVAAGAVGSMKACRDEATAYAKQRHAFGKPIIEQLVQQLLAGMQLRIDAGELLVLKAALLKNAGVRSSREASSAKWFCAEAAQQCANDAVRVLGSAGFGDEHDAARHLRNSMASVIYQGTAQIHTLIQADYLSGKRADKPLRCELPPYIQSN